MNGDKRKAKVLELRKHDIVGECVILRPASERYAEEIVRLRNKPKNIYMFNQGDTITLDGQTKWFESYKKKTDDIYWCVLNKDERFVGTIRLYEIDEEGESCEEGSYAIDDEFSDEAPYAVEAKMLVLDVAFDVLHIKTMINDNRADNKIMNNIDNQLGFDKGHIIKIRDVDYLHRLLSADVYHENRYKFSRVVDYWSKR